MSALKEFANFITLNVANLAATYDQLLVENSESYTLLPTDRRIAQARRLIKTVAEACESGASDPLCRLFDARIPPASPQPLLEVECLGQTLTPVVTNLEAGKFLWQALSEVRAIILRLAPSGSSLASMPPLHTEAINTAIISGQPSESELSQERVLLRTLIDNLPDYIYVKDTGSRFILLNMATARLLRASSVDEVIGKTDFDFFSPELAHQFRADEQALIQSAQPLLNYEEQIIDQTTGQTRWTLTSKIPLQDNEGKVIGLVGINRDITERKQAEEALRFTQFTLDRSPVGAAWVGPEAQLLYVNDAVCHSLGYSREELLSMAIYDINPALTPEMWSAHWEELKQRKSFTFDTQHRRKNGEMHPVDITVNYIEFNGLEYNCTLWQDITERKRLGQQIQESLARRTRQIQAITEVAQQIAGTLTLNDLFQQVVDLMQSQFGYYHAQIYTMVEGDMALQAGTGEVGHRLKERGYKIPLSTEQSLVIRTMWEGEPVLVPDVSQEPAWLPNPLLPETKAELAVPINLGAEILGVLDVQSDKLGGLNEEDRLLLVGLCGQIAIVIETRRVEAERVGLLAEAERRARREQTIREITEKMRAAISLQELAKITARELGQQLAAGHAVVELGIETEPAPGRNRQNSSS